MSTTTHPEILLVEQPHSIDAHPLRSVLTPDEFHSLSRQVQYCQSSWPVCIEIVRTAIEREVQGPRYSVGTWDADLQAFTPQAGVPAFNLTLWELKASLRMLRKCGYSAHRRREIVAHPNGWTVPNWDDNDTAVLVERTDGRPEREIMENWKR
jgi:hypothetical protein